MAFIRTNKRENPFVQMDKRFTEDSKLTWAAKGLLAYILSRPNNWKINQADLVKRSACGDAVVRNALLNLMEHGYIYYYADRNEKGQINEWIYEVYETPEFNPYHEEAQKKAKEKIAEQKERNRKKVKKRKVKEEIPHQVNPDLESPSYNNIVTNNIVTNNIDSSNNLSIEEGIEIINTLNLPIGIKIVLENQIVRLIEYKISPSDIELHYHAIKATYDLKEYTYVLNVLLKQMTQKPDSFENVLNNWLKRNRDKQNEVAEQKKATGYKPLRTEIVPEWLSNDEQASAKAEEVDPGFQERAAKLQAKLKEKYPRKAE